MTEERFKFVNNCGDWHLKDSFNNQEVAYDVTSPSMDKTNWTNVCKLLNKQDYIIRKQECLIAKQGNKLNQLLDIIPNDKILCKEQSVEDIAFYCKRYHDYRCIPYCSSEKHCYHPDKTFQEKLEEEKRLWKKLKPI